MTLNFDLLTRKLLC